MAERKSELSRDKLPDRITDVPAVHYVIPGIPLNKFQNSLPKLPVPDLQETLDRYLESVKPLMDDEEFKTTTEVVRDFGKPGGEGEELHAYLAKRAEGLEGETEYPYGTWLEEWWDKYAYLTDRTPTAVFISYFGTLWGASAHPFPLQRAASVIWGCCKFKEALQNGNMGPDCLDRRGNYPICMFQYSRLFSSCRVPHAEEDYFESHPESRHVVVNCQGRFYKLMAMAEDGSVLSLAFIHAQLTAIHAQAHSMEQAPLPFAALTTQDRTLWAKQRALLAQACPHTLKAVEGALFHLILSDSQPRDARELITLGQCGDGGRTMWFDKSCTIVVAANGKAVFAGEHAHADAPVPARLMECMNQLTKAENLQGLASWSDGECPKAAAVPIGLPTPVVTELVFDVDANHPIVECISAAMLHMQTMMEKSKLQLVKFDDFGIDFLKKARLGPDSFAQMALQLAFFRDQQRVAGTYETATTRRFYHGRTETIRSLTPASKAFVGAFDKSDVPMEQKMSLLRAGMSSHLDYLRDCVLGEGVDRVLMGMRIVAAGLGRNPPAIFTDPAYSRSTRFELSTSNMSFRGPDFPGFGAPFPYSYGVCYNLCPDKLLFTVTSNADAAEKDAFRFSELLVSALRDMKRLVLATANPKAKL